MRYIYQEIIPQELRYEVFKILEEIFQPVDSSLYTPDTWKKKLPH